MSCHPNDNFTVLSAAESSVSWTDRVVRGSTEAVTHDTPLPAAASGAARNEGRHHVDTRYIRRPAGRTTAAAIAGLVALTGVSTLATPAQANTTPVATPAEGGTVVGWGPDVALPGKSGTIGHGDLDAAQRGLVFTQVVAGGYGGGLGLTTTGTVEFIGTPIDGLDGAHEIPHEEVASHGGATQLASTDDGAGQALAVTSDGHVVVWGDLATAWPPIPLFTGYLDAGDVPADLANVVAADIAPTGQWAAAVKADGTVVAWGGPGPTATTPNPPLTAAITQANALSNVKSLALWGNFGYALHEDGTATGFGTDSFGSLSSMPAILGDATDNIDVIDVTARSNGGMALLDDGTVASWGNNTTAGGTPGFNDVPAGVDDVVAIDTTGIANVAVDGAGQAYFWGSKSEPALSDVQSTILAGQHVTSISLGRGALAIVDFKATARPGVTVNDESASTAAVGDELHATDATFSSTPDAEGVTGQWYRGAGVDAEAIDDATDADYTVTGEDIGEAITYRTTATKGSATVFSESDPITVEQAASTTTVSAPTTAYGRSATVTVSVTNATSGKVTLTGAGVIPPKDVSSSGKATFVLPRTLTPRSYALTAKYAGTDATSASSGTATLRVARAAAGKPVLRVTKRPSRKKAGKATITVPTSAGLAKASGKVIVTLKLGKKAKRASGTLRNGTVSVKLPRLPKKGKWSVTATYVGDARYLPGTSRTLKIRVR